MQVVLYNGHKMLVVVYCNISFKDSVEIDE